MTIQITKPETPKVRKQLVERPNIQTLSLKAIVADAAFQSRIETDPAHVLTFDEMIREGHAIHPVTVFWTGERYILADGFHRYHAHMKRGLDSIQAVVMFGSERDAMIHSAGANRLSIKPPTVADRKKAVMMLLDDEEWRNKPDNEIAKHVGLTSGTSVRRYKMEFSSVTGKPTRIVTKPKKTDKRKASKKGDGGFTASINGKQIYIGTNKHVAEERLRDAENDFQRKCMPYKLDSLRKKIACCGGFAEPLGFTSHTKISGGVVNLVAFDTAGFADVLSVRDAILNVLLVRKAKCDGGRAIVLGYLEVANKPVLEIIELAKPLGVEFMTPEEFIDSFAATDESAPTDEPMLD